MKPLPKVPGYELLTRLGGGLLTSVYSARELATDTSCAVKVIRADWEDQTTAIKLLQREARACLALEHRHLVQIREAHVTKPPYFLVMDLLPGESLRRRLQREYQLSAVTALWIVRQIAEALTALHRSGFVHGDVKPDNIHLVSDGHAVLIDLGFAHRPGENTAMFQQGYVLGTVDYLAPELCTPQPRDELGSDVFSLGVTLFEMLTGQLPYPRGTVAQTMHRHACNRPIRLRELLRPCHTALAHLLERMMVCHPQDRPRIQAIVPQLVSLEIVSLRRGAAVVR